MNSKVVWCDKCGRIVGLGCDCDTTFGDKIKTQAINYKWEK